MPCNDACFSCETSSTDCTACKSTSGKFLDGNECVTSCPDGAYGSTVTYECEPCPDGCTLCTGDIMSLCTGCTQATDTNHYYLQTGEGCKLVCNDGYFEVTATHTCDLCQGCATCETIATNCLTCTGTNYSYLKYRYLNKYSTLKR